MTRLALSLCATALLAGPVLPLAAQPVNPPPLHVCSLKLRDGSMKLVFVEAAALGRLASAACRRSTRRLAAGVSAASTKTSFIEPSRSLSEHTCRGGGLTG